MAEMRAWKSLGRHPNIVVFKGMRQEVNVFFMLMEICPYALYDRVMQAPSWTAIELMSDFRQALQGLAHMHSLRIVHRDVKVQNFLYGQKGSERVLKITDFGLSVKIPAGMQLESVCGSPAFMAPEMVLKKGYGLKIDMWALGVTFFMMMHGALLVGKSSMTVPQMKEAIKDPNGTKKSIQLATKKSELSFDDVRDLKFASLDMVKTLTAREPEGRPSAAAMLKCTFLNWPCKTPQEEKRLNSVLVVSRPAPASTEYEDSAEPADQKRARHSERRDPRNMMPVLPGESSARLASGRPSLDMAGVKRRLEIRGLSDRGGGGEYAESPPDGGRRYFQDDNSLTPIGDASRQVGGASLPQEFSSGSARGSLDIPSALNENMFSDDRMMDANPNRMFQAFSNASSAAGALNSAGLNVDVSRRFSESYDRSVAAESLLAPAKPPPEGDPPALPSPRGSQCLSDDDQAHGARLSVPGENQDPQSEPAPEPDNPRD